MKHGVLLLIITIKISFGNTAMVFLNVHLFIFISNVKTVFHYKNKSKLFKQQVVIQTELHVIFHLYFRVKTN